MAGAARRSATGIDVKTARVEADCDRNHTEVEASRRGRKGGVVREVYAIVVQDQMASRGIRGGVHVNDG